MVKEIVLSHDIYDTNRAAAEVLKQGINQSLKTYYGDVIMGIGQAIKVRDPSFHVKLIQSSQAIEIHLHASSPLLGKSMMLWFEHVNVDNDISRPYGRIEITDARNKRFYNSRRLPVDPSVKGLPFDVINITTFEVCEAIKKTTNIDIRKEPTREGSDFSIHNYALQTTYP